MNTGTSPSRNLRPPTADKTTRPQVAPRPRKRIAILGYGTRGDIQPLLAVGEELERRGHSVAITVNTNLVEWAAPSGLEIVPIPPDSESFLKSEGGRRMLADGRVVAFAEELAKLEHSVNAGIDEGCSRCVAGADLVLSTGLTAFRGFAQSEARGLPHRLLSTMPLHKTGAYASLLGPVRKTPWASLNRWSYPLMYGLWWRNFAAAHAETRKGLGLPPNTKRPRIEDLESVALYSTALVPNDSDRGPDRYVAGFVRMSTDMRARVGEAELPPGLEDWLSQGPPPVFFGFGSLPVLHPDQLLADVAALTQKLGLRALVGAGWSSYELGELPAHVFLSPPFDHERVLPRCRAAVHHGGAGTTATALRAGLPCVVLSSFGDQPFWGWCVKELGAGTAVPFQKLTRTKLEAALQAVLGSAMCARARELGAQLEAEQGQVCAADVIESWL